MLRPDENKPKFMSGKNAVCRAPTFCRMEAGLRVSRAHITVISSLQESNTLDVIF